MRKSKLINSLKLIGAENTQVVLQLDGSSTMYSKKIELVEDQGYQLRDCLISKQVKNSCKTAESIIILRIK